MSRQSKLLRIIVILIILIPLLFSCAKKKPRSKYIYTPNVQGKVIDAKTKKSIKDAYIKITWEVINYEHETWGELSEYYLKVVKFTTDKQGKFIMPMQKRSSFFERTRIDENFLLIKVFAHRHKSKTYRVDGRLGKPTDLSNYKKKLVFKLEPVRTADEWIKEMGDSDSNLRTQDVPSEVSPDFRGIDFLLDEYKLFINRYPNDGSISFIKEIMQNLEKYKEEKERKK